MSSKQNNYRRPEKQDNPQVGFENMVKIFMGNNPYVKDLRKNDELEVRFGTKGIQRLTKIDYDNVIRKLKSFGFVCSNEQGENKLRIQK